MTGRLPSFLDLWRTTKASVLPTEKSEDNVCKPTPCWKNELLSMLRSIPDSEMPYSETSTAHPVAQNVLVTKGSRNRVARFGLE